MDPSPFTYGVECATMGVQYFHRHEAGGSEMNSNKTVVRLGTVIRGQTPFSRSIP